MTGIAKNVQKICHTIILNVSYALSLSKNFRRGMLRKSKFQ